MEKFINIRWFYIRRIRINKDMNKKQKLLVASAVAIILIILGVRTIYLKETNENEKSKLNIIATFYPLEFLTSTLGGEYVSVTSLVPENTEIHSFQPSISDIVKIQTADILIYNGAGADHWFEEDILPTLDDSTPFVVKTSNNVSLLAVHDSENDYKFKNGGKYDPHTWLSPFIAQQEAKCIYEALVLKDPLHKKYYENRWNDTQALLVDLDTDYNKSLSTAEKHDIFVTHAAYGYLADRYGFRQHGIIGLSADEQPSVATIATMVKQMEEYDIYVVYIDPIYSDAYAHTLKQTLEEKTGKNVVFLNLYLMLGYTHNLDYFDQMETNLNALKIGLDAHEENEFCN